MVGISKSDIDTPALLVDLDTMQSNIARMAAFFADRPAGLRPHVKSHKTPQIARRQIEAGAIGLTCAKVGEAEVMAQAGPWEILVANQIVTPRKIERLVDVARRNSVMVAVDDRSNAASVAAACRNAGVEIRVVIEVDIGMRRCGVAPGQPTVDLAREICRMPGVAFAGVMGFEGHLVLIDDEEERRAATEEALAALLSTAGDIRRRGMPVEIITGGGTGTYTITGAYPGVTEVQAGSYVFNDARYRQVRGTASEFGCSLSLLSTIVSRPSPGLAIVDAGLKSITKEFGLPEVIGIDEARVAYLSEEHAKVEITGPASDLNVGDKIELLPSHCCTTVNLHDRLYGMRDGKVEEVWPIEARGRCQ